ncbi:MULTISPECIES: class I SAM-dependent methyltransferase [unclassified Kitasatospora]|uniref:class I SAM-dependent methyltransferase n=1 Tax=unclassified Kitasatospora TaxID=2633591 RepID=UPI00381DB10E
MTTGQISDPFPVDEDAGDDEPDVLRRRAARALQAVAFDTIGTGYAEAFPAKDGQLACGHRLLAALEPGAAVLDVGCGAGDPTVRQLVAGGAHVTGIDLSDVMLTLARQAGHGGPHPPAFHRIDLYDLATERADRAWNVPELGPRGRGTFAAVTAFFSLILLPQDEIPTVLARLRELLRPGGLLALGMVEADLDHVPLPFLGRELRISGYLREDLERVLVESGFAVEERSGHSYAPASTSLPPEEQLFLCCRRVG